MGFTLSIPLGWYTSEIRSSMFPNDLYLVHPLRNLIKSYFDFCLPLILLFFSLFLFNDTKWLRIAGVVVAFIVGVACVLLAILPRV